MERWRFTAGHLPGPFGLLLVRSGSGVAQSGDPAHFQAQRFLRLEDRAGPKGVAAVQRQRMVEDVENAGHRRFP